MKRIIFFIALLVVAVSCQENESNAQSQAQTDAQPQQTGGPAFSFLSEGMSEDDKIQAIEAKVEQVQKANLKNPVKKIKLPNNAGSIGILENEGAAFRIAQKLTPEEEEWMTIYYLEGNHIMLYKQREWIQHTQPPYAREVTYYLDQNGIFKAVERYGELEPGQNPSGVLGLPPVDIKLDKDSLYQTILASYEDLRKTIAGNK